MQFFMLGLDQYVFGRYPGDADINNDGIVNLYDFNSVATFWLAQGVLFPPASDSDINNDQSVDTLDIEALSGFWLSQPKTLSVSIEDLFNTTIVIDGNVSAYPQTSQNIGWKFFDVDSHGDRVKVSTGIDVGSWTIGGETDDTQFEYFKIRIDHPTYSTGVRRVVTADDIYSAYQNNDYALLFYCQVHPPINNDENTIDQWYNDGLRVLQLAYSDATYSDPNKITNWTPDELLAGGGGGGSEDTTGLTNLGERVVARMVDLGMVIDLSHGNEKSTVEVAAYLASIGRSDIPITANHAVALGLQKDQRYRRGKSDREIFTIAKTGGVTGMFTYGPWVKVENDEDSLSDPNANIDDFVQHINYCVALLKSGDGDDGGKVYNGTEFIGISTDGYLDGTMPNGNHSSDGLLDAPKRFLHIFQALADTGYYTEQDLRNMMGLNYLRVYNKVLGVSAFPTGVGSITRQVYNGIVGNDISTMTSLVNYPALPDQTETLFEFDSPPTGNINYGDRIYGKLTVPVSGPYSFWVSGDDDCELWVSSDGSPANKLLRASLTGWTGYQQFDKFLSQRSAYIELVAGQQYYIEALHKNGDGPGHLSVAWQGVHFNRKIIEGAYLSPPDAP